jgi:TolA-binding protein
MYKLFKFSLLITVLQLLGAPSFAQNSLLYIDEDYNYRTGVELYNKQKYAQAQQYFERVVDYYGNELTDIKADAQYYMALCALELFNDDAEFRIGNFIEQYPESPRTRVAYFEMGRYQYRVGKFDRAVEFFEKVWKQNLTKEQLEEYYFKKGYAYFKLEQNEKAAKMFYEILDKNTKYSAPAIYYYAHIAYLDKNFETALNNFKKLEQDPTFAPVVPYYQVQIYYLQGKNDQVLEMGSKMLQESDSKRQAEISRIVGEALYNKKQYTEALPYLETYKSKADNYTRDDIYQLGYTYYMTGNYQQSITTFSNVTNVDDALSQNAYFQIANANLQLMQKDQARMAFEAASKSTFNDEIREQSLLNYAKLSYELAYSPFNETIKAFQEYLDSYPNSIHHDDAYSYLAKVYLSSKNYQSALESLNKINTKTPEMQSAWQRVAYFRGLELFNNLKFDESIKAFDQAINLKAYDKQLQVLALYWKAEAQYRLEDFTEASATYNQFLLTPGAYSLDEYNACYYNLGYCYFKLKQYEVSANWFKKFTDKGEKVNRVKLADSYIRMGDCYFVTSKYNEAVNNYSMAVNLDTFDVEYAMFQQGFSMGLIKNQSGKINVLTQLLTRFPQSNYAADALFERGRSHNAIDSIRLAIADFKLLVNTYPNSSYVVKSLLQLGLAYYAESNNNLALDNFKLVIGRYPGTPEAVEALASMKNVYVDMNKVDDYFIYVKEQGGLGDVSFNEKDSLTYMAAEKIYMTGNWQQSVGLFSSYLSKYPSGKFILNAHYYRGDCQIRLEKPDSAQNDFLYIVSKPKNIFTEPSLLDAALIADKRKDYKKACELYLQLENQAEVKSNLIIARKGQMLSAFADSNFNTAIEAARNVLITDKVTEEEVRQARRIMAIGYLRIKQFDPALTQFRILALDVKSAEGAEAKYQVALILFNQGDLQKSETEINEFISSGTTHMFWLAKAFFLLSDIYLKKDDRFQAKANLQSVIENYGDESDGIINEAKAKLQAIVDKENSQFNQTNE